MNNFDMEQLLNLYNGDAEKLANDFAQSLNEELAKQHQVNCIDEAAEEVADAWEEFIDEYFEQEELPSGYTEEDFYIDAHTVKLLADCCVKAIPYLTMLENSVKTLTKALNGDEPKQTDKTITDFDKVMAEFFKKNDI